MQAAAFPDWRKSSYSPNNNNCVEVGIAQRQCAVRDSKLGDAGPVLAFPARTFAAFLGRVKR